MHRGSPPVVPDSFLHTLLQVCARQVVLADIHIGDCSVLQLLGELLPGLQADLKVLPSIQRPNAALLQHLHQSQELIVKHALHSVKTCVLPSGQTAVMLA